MRISIDDDEDSHPIVDAGESQRSDEGRQEGIHAREAPELPDYHIDEGDFLDVSVEGGSQMGVGIISRAVDVAGCSSDTRPQAEGRNGSGDLGLGRGPTAVASASMWTLIICTLIHLPLCKIGILLAKTRMCLPGRMMRTKETAVIKVWRNSQHQLGPKHLWLQAMTHRPKCQHLARSAPFAKTLLPRENASVAS